MPRRRSIQSEGRVIFKGKPVEYAVHNRSGDTYSLMNSRGECVAELQRREFLSIPNRSTLEVRSGRYRSASEKDNRSANRKSRSARRDDANPWLGPGTITYTPAGKSPVLTRADYAKLFLGTDYGEPKQKPPLRRDGIVAGEIVAYRCWRIENGELRSVYQKDVWKPGDILQGREIGDWDTRGIHAWKDPASHEYRAYIRGYLNSASDGLFLFFQTPAERLKEHHPAMVTGTVFLWGDVVEHERGYRAEFARVRSLDWLYPDETMMGREAETLDALRDLYGCRRPA